MHYFLLLKNALIALSLYQAYALLLLRVLVGYLFLMHGAPKWKNFEQTSLWFESQGFKPRKFWTGFIIILEIIGGPLFALGLFTQFLGALYAIQMLVVVLKVKRGEQFMGGYELELLLALVCLVFVMMGAGPLSLDRRFWGL